MTTGTKATEKKPDAGSFLRGVKTELKKVNWPNRQEITSYVGVVLFMCTLTGLVLGIFDTVFQKLISTFL